MKLNLNKKQTLSIAAVLGIGVVLAGLILGTGKPQPAGDEQGQDSHAEAPGHADEEPHAAEAGPAKGPHGGKLFNDNGYGLEVTIFEQGVPPEFRVYLYRDGKPVDPSSSHGCHYAASPRARTASHPVCQGRRVTSGATPKWSSRIRSRWRSPRNLAARRTASATTRLKRG